VCEPGLLKRLAAVLSLAAHLVLVGAGPVADALSEVAEIESSAGAVHVEDASLPSCERHQHSTCLVCRTLQTLNPAPDEGPGLPCIDRHSTRMRSGPALAVGVGAWLVSVSPRAPPPLLAT
jgi:hypothetical protein